MTLGARQASQISCAGFRFPRQISRESISSTAGVERVMAGPKGDPLLEGLAAGREGAFAVLYDRFADRLFRVARMLSGSAHDAEDAVQEVFVGLMRARKTLGQIENLQAYLFAALRRAVARFAEARKEAAFVKFHEAGEPAAPTPLEILSEQTVRLERALMSLPNEQRELIALKIDGGLTFAEIAHLLGISANTAASRYRYALEKLRASLEGV